LEDPTRYTYSSLLSKLKDIEDAIKVLYIELYNECVDEDLKNLIKYMYEDTAKRIEELEWIRDFMVIEMTLEPIIGPDIFEYLNKIKSITGKEVTKSLLKKIEEIRIMIYDKVLGMLKYISPEAYDVIESFKEQSINIVSML